MTAGISATAVFFCNVTGATNGVTYRWRQTQNGVIPVNVFPMEIFGTDRVIGRDMAILRIKELGGLEQNYDYTCTVSISGMEIGSATGTLTSPGVYSVIFFVGYEFDSLSPSPLFLPLGRSGDPDWPRESGTSSW